MIVRNTERDAVLGEAIEVAETAAQRVKGLLGRDTLADGQGLLFNHCSSLHTFFMHFPIDIIFADKNGKVLKLAPAVRPFKLVAAPFHSFYAVELPEGAIDQSKSKVGDHLVFDAEAYDELIPLVDTEQSA